MVKKLARGMQYKLSCRMRIILSALLVAFGVAVAGWFVGDGFVQGRSADRYVTVKGVSEREVRADIALWPIEFTATDDGLGAAQRKIDASRSAVLTFLKSKGIGEDSVRVARLKVKDRLADPYRSGPIASRFILTQRLLVRTDDPALVENASQQVGELVASGVVLSGDSYDLNPSYLFTRLSDFKPDMIAEATARARQAAEQFARDSGSDVGSIRRANQGVFVIRPRDSAGNQNQQAVVDKTLRVVTTVEYFLED